MRTTENTQRNPDIQKVLFDVTYALWLILCNSEFMLNLIAN